MNAREALHYKNAAGIAERKADEAAASPAPWALRNLRVYQNLMCRLLDQRHAVIRAYLNMRKARK